MVRELKAREVEFTVEAEPEDVPVRGNALSSGDERVDRECEDEIICRLNDSDVWAWCHVVVTAKWNGFVGRAGLGGCSYDGESDFRKNSCYFPDLCDEALADLNHVVADHARRLEPLSA